MVAAGLREVMLRGAGAGPMHGPDVAVCRAEHVVCGDEIVLFARVQSGVVRALQWQASACPASTAVAALAAAVLPGTALAELPQRLRAAIIAHGGLQAHERHAEAMVLRALAMLQSATPPAEPSGVPAPPAGND